MYARSDRSPSSLYFAFFLPHSFFLCFCWLPRPSHDVFLLPLIWLWVVPIFLVTTLNDLVVASQLWITKNHFLLIFFILRLLPTSSFPLLIITFFYFSSRILFLSFSCSCLYLSFVQQRQNFSPSVYQSLSLSLSLSLPLSFPCLSISFLLPYCLSSVHLFIKSRSHLCSNINFFFTIHLVFSFQLRDLKQPRWTQCDQMIEYNVFS